MLAALVVIYVASVLLQRCISAVAVHIVVCGVFPSSEAARRILKTLSCAVISLFVYFYGRLISPLIRCMPQVWPNLIFYRHILPIPTLILFEYKGGEIWPGFLTPLIFEPLSVWNGARYWNSKAI